MRDMESEVDGVLVAAHELKAPLGLLRQLALTMDFKQDSIQELQKAQSQIIGVSERALRQVNDLAKIARLQERLFEMEPVSVRGVCEDVTSELADWFRFNKKGLVMNYKNKTRLVTANRELLYSVIYNFCLNAMHYSNDETFSELKVVEQKGIIRIKVRDFGPALPMEVWKALRDGWLKQPTAIAMRPGSSGLGLYIASKFASYMNAKIGAIRHKDGTSFFVDMPISKQLSLW